MSYVGDIKLGQKIYIYWNSANSSGASVDRSTDGEIRVYKKDSLSQLTGSAITDTEAFAGLTGAHLAIINTSDNSGQAGFFAVGNDYGIALAGATINGESVNRFIGSFSIENRTAASIIIPACTEPPTANEIAVKVWSQENEVVVRGFSDNAKGQLNESVAGGLSLFGVVKQSDVDSTQSALEALLNDIKSKTDELAFTDKKVHALIFGGGNSGLKQNVGTSFGGVNISSGSR